MSMQERMTLANMTAELGGQTGLVDPDETTAAFILAAGADPGDIACWQSDADAKPAEHHRFDAAALAPQVAAPHSPANAAPVAEHASVPIDVAHVGACTGAKLVDLRMAAQVLKGRRVHPGVSLLIAPASRREQEAARQEGTLQILLDAGAKLLPNACGMCAGYGGSLNEDVTCISSIARNFRGRMGPQSARIYLGSPYTVAASAVRGHITDPRELLP
jgi:3-isopropylmalate/(R)-2-methylmalate dehydratase large subunit